MLIQRREGEDRGREKGQSRAIVNAVACFDEELINQLSQYFVCLKANLQSQNEYTGVR